MELVDYPIISIIVPVYNVENYLDRCVRSIVSQNYDLCEIILVNDGSTDSSGTICNTWSNQFNWIKTLHKSNGGLSSARNLGLEHARGKFIWFVDSDDFLAPNVLGRIIETALKLDAQILYFPYREFDGVSFSDTIGNYYPGIFSGRDILEKQLASFSAWGMISLRSLWITYSLRFVEGIVFEDLELAPRLLKLVNRVGFLGQGIVPYIYFLRSSSITRERNLEKKYKQIDSFFAVEESWKSSFDLVTPSPNSYDMVMVKVGTNKLHRGLLNFVRYAPFSVAQKIRLYYVLYKKGVFSIVYNGILRCDISTSNFLSSMFWNTIGRSLLLFSIFSVFDSLKRCLKN